MPPGAGGRRRSAFARGLISAGGEITQGRLRRFNVGQVQSALEAATDRLVSARTQEQLKSVWSNLEPALVQSLEARMKDRLDGMRRLLKEREEKEISDIRAVLGELEAMIRRELAEPEYQQLDLFTSSEREQYNRNVQALRMRLAQIPMRWRKRSKPLASAMPILSPGCSRWQLRF